jgi:YHS domain-containing protein
MRRTAVLLSAALTLAACDATTVPQPNAQSEMRTINSAPPRPAVLDAPPTLQDEAPPPKPKVMPWETPTPIVFTPEDEKLRASLPFTPAIAMDPIDGSKLSIRAATPTFEYKGKIYYFSSEENKRTFVAKPDEYMKGAFTKL